MTRDEIIEEEMELIRIDVVKNYDSLGMRASGNFAIDTLVENRGNKNILIAPSYALQLIKGRKPGTWPKIGGIIDWIRTKGIKPVEQTLKISSLAFLIARSIKEKGNKYFRQGGTDLLDAVITPERIQRIINRLKEFTVLDLQTRIQRELQAIAI